MQVVKFCSINGYHFLSNCRKVIVKFVGGYVFKKKGIRCSSCVCELVYDYPYIDLEFCLHTACKILKTVFQERERDIETQRQREETELGEIILFTQYSFFMIF